MKRLTRNGILVSLVWGVIVAVVCRDDLLNALSFWGLSVLNLIFLAGFWYQLSEFLSKKQTVSVFQVIIWLTLKVFGLGALILYISHHTESDAKVILMGLGTYCIVPVVAGKLEK